MEPSAFEKIDDFSAEELLKGYQLVCISLFCLFTDLKDIYITILFLQLQIPCKDIFANCSWNNMKFDCCKEFKPLNKTGVGYCYAINSRHIKPYDDSMIKFWINRTTENGNIVIDLLANKKSSSYIPRFVTVRIFLFLSY